MNANPKYSDLFDRRNNKIVQASYASNIHPNETFYKYYWLVFHHKSVEGRDFFNTQKMCTYDAMSLIESLEKNNKGFLIYNWNRPRTGKNIPFDFTSNKWRNVLVAPTFDDDTDPLWKNYK